MNPNKHLTHLHFKIDQLGCASCAVRIEEALSSLSGVEAVRLDFATANLKVSLDQPQDLDHVKARIQSVIQTIEQDACLIDPATEADRPGRAGLAAGLTLKPVLRLLTGAVLLVIPWLVSLPALWGQGLWLAAYLLLGLDVLWTAVRNLARRQWFDEHFLMGLATLGALAIGDFAEAVAVMLFYQTGEYLQDLAVGHSRHSVRALLAIQPDQALRLNPDGSTQAVLPGQLAVGEHLLIRPGDRVALDSRILTGRSELDTAALTGESRLRPVTVGDDILAGSINGAGVLTAQVLRSESDSSVHRILTYVEEAAAAKAPAERFITRFSRSYTPVMVILALLVAFVPPLLFGQPLHDWVYKALILLVISCPCALVLSIPLGYFAGIGRASANGVLIKGGQFLDRLAAVRTLAWDKTGTLTDGTYVVSRVLAAQDGQADQVLEWAALIEQGSSHPLAQSIVAAWQASGRPLPQASRIQEQTQLPGLGLRARADGHTFLLGNAALMHENKVPISHWDISKQEQEETAVLYLAVDGQPAGALELKDALRADARQTVQALRRLGIREQVLLSGDHPQRVAALARAVDLDAHRGGLLPEGKIEALEAMLADGLMRQPFAFVGDGINDTPLLARADLAIALGGGSDAALETADVVIVGDQLDKLPQAIRLARRTGRIIRQNIVLALGFKLAVFLLALLGHAGIWQAVFADVGVTLLAVLNALRLLKKETQVDRGS